MTSFTYSFYIRLSLGSTNHIRSKALLTKVQDRQYGSDKFENYLFRCAPQIQACVDIYMSNNNVPRTKWSIKTATAWQCETSALYVVTIVSFYIPYRSYLFTLRQIRSTRTIFVIKFIRCKISSGIRIILVSCSWIMILKTRTIVTILFFIFLITILTLSKFFGFRYN